MRPRSLSDSNVLERRYIAFLVSRHLPSSRSILAQKCTRPYVRLDEWVFFDYQRDQSR